MTRRHAYVAFVFAAFCVVGAPTTLLAATAVPPIAVKNVTTDSETYSQGSLVRGTFQIVNPSNANISNLKYVVRLVGGYGAGTVWSSEYVAETSEPITLNARETGTLPFSLTIPQNLAGNDFGIEVQALYGTGFPLGWGTKRISISGANAFAKVLEAYVQVNTSTFSVGEGPTIHPGDTATLLGKISTDGPSLTLTPSVVYKTMDGLTVRSNTAESLTISGTEAEIFSIPIPTDFSQGVYTAEVTLTDTHGNPRAVLLTYRFIIAGEDIATIHSAFVASARGKAGETIAVDVIFAGTPPDINPVAAPRTSSNGPATLSVSLFNESDTRVGTASVSIDLGDETRKSVPVTLSDEATALRVSVTITNARGTLASLEVPLTRTYDAAAKKPFVIIFYILAVAALLAAVFGLAMLRHRRSSSSADTPVEQTRPHRIATALLVLAVLLGLAAAGLFALYPKLSKNPVSINLIPVAHAVDLYYDPYYYDPCGGLPCEPGGPTVTYATYTDDGGRWDEYIRRYLPVWDLVGAFYHVRNFNYAAPVKSYSITANAYAVGNAYDPTIPIQTYLTLDDVYAQNRGDDAGTHTLMDRAPASGRTTTPTYLSMNGFLFAPTQTPVISLNPLELPLAPGETFIVEGSVAYQECLNVPAAFVIQGTFADQQSTSTIDANTSYAHAITSASKRFSLSGFTAPTQPGTYRMDLAFGWGFAYTPMGGTRLGHIDFTVAGPTAALSAQPTEISAGDSSTLTSVCSDAESASIVPTIGSVATTTTLSVVHPVATTTVYTLTCTDANGARAEAHATINIVSPAAPPPPACGDGVDNDGDGKIDSQDPGCGGSTTSITESPQCNDGLDNNGNTLVDTSDPACANDVDNNEEPLPAPDLALASLRGTIRAGQQARLTWGVENIVPGSCVLAGDNGDTWSLSGVSGEQFSSPLQNQTFFILSCRAAENNLVVQATTTVRVAPQFDEI